MKKISCLVCCLALLGACSKHDPILPGVREPIFDTQSFNLLNQDISGLTNEIPSTTKTNCPYTQDSSNTIWKGETKIFSGFPTSNLVKSDQKPVCSGKYVYAGLTTGELVKIDTSNKNVVWTADIYSNSIITGGSSILDIVAPISIINKSVYVGGLGDAFCKLNTNNGKKLWCIQIGTALPFIITNKAAFVVGTDNYLYAIRTTDGSVFWRTKVKEQTAPIYADAVISVGNQKINAVTGNVLDEK